MTRSDYDFDELVEEYGAEYVQEYYPDDMLYPMDEISEFVTDVWEALRSSFFGYDYNPYSDENREKFNPNRDYFAFNAYGNLVSIDSRDYVAWLQRMISEDEFVDWCIEQGYIDEDEDIDGCGALVTALQPRYDSRASFYGKAQVIESEDGTVLSLVSYDTTVATFDRLSRTLDVFGYFSATTARHIREFAKQLGITLPKGSDIKGRYQI